MCDLTAKSNLSLQAQCVTRYTEDDIESVGYCTKCNVQNYTKNFMQNGSLRTPASHSRQTSTAITVIQENCLLLAGYRVIGLSFGNFSSYRSLNTHTLLHTSSHFSKSAPLKFVFKEHLRLLRQVGSPVRFESVGLTRVGKRRTPFALVAFNSYLTLAQHWQ